ncbi:acyltransferase family protein [Paenibacillus sp. NPDC058071]|uniref:acyltransferase family protein n=1 Tax=Paenibacillus sp. NPDC058071 TaxID=3346326 RepID=UPI0036DB8F58
MKSLNQTLLGLRGLLALSVVIFHIYGSAIIEGYITESSKEHLLYLLHYAGPISVDLFFVISGYLITQSLLNKRTLGEFAINRIIRIYPVFLLIHLIVFTFGPFIDYKWMAGIGVKDYVLHFISNALLLPGMLQLPIAQIVSWTLSYELFFYLVAGVVWFVYRSSKLNKLGKSILYLLLFVCCAIIVYHRMDLLFFAVGVVAYFSQDWIKQRWQANKFFYLNGLIFLAAMYVSFQTLEKPLAAALILSFLFFMTIIRESGLVSSILRTRLMSYLGKISYSLYMWHTMVMFPLKVVVPKMTGLIGSPSLSVVLYAILSLVLSIGIAHFSYEFVEVRFSGYLKRKWKRKNHPPIQAELKT